MADLSITGTNVIPSTGCVYIQGIAGGTITAGQSIYYNGTTWATATSGTQADSGGASTVNAGGATYPGIGIALEGASVNQSLNVCVGGYIYLGAVGTVGETYIVSNNAGGIAPVGDIASGKYIVHLGLMIGTGTISVYVRNPNVAHA
jgi:hypothetical protein